MKLQLVVLLVVVALVASALHEEHEERGKRELTKCQREARDAKLTGKRAPVCTGKGKYKRKQCDARKCWCVNGNTGDRKYQITFPHGLDYNCKRKPKKCLNEFLSISGHPDRVWHPRCDKRGFYSPKQCVPGRRKQCRGQGRRKRQAPTCGSGCHVGFAAIDRPKLDSSDTWTVVSKDTFATGGTISAFQIYVGGAGKDFSIGIYAPHVSNTTCKFVLQQQQLFSGGFPAGLQTVDLVGLGYAPFTVVAGYSYGITWYNGGAIDYSGAATFNYCEDGLSFAVGATATLKDLRYGDREYSICMQFGSSPSPSSLSTFGFAPDDKDNLDSGTLWTMVCKEPFCASGDINSFEIYVGGAYKPLSVGVYRPTGTGNCNFTLVQEVDFPTGFSLGYNVVTLTPFNVLYVEAGDRYGFTWTASGVIEYDSVVDQNYCEDEVDPNVGQVVDLVDNRYGNREYAIRFALSDGTVGFAAVHRAFTDNIDNYTMVSKDSFLSAGQVYAFDVYVGVTPGTLRLGIYTETSTPCEFTLKQQVVFASLSPGFQTVTLAGGNVLCVNAGDHYGISWTNGGVVEFNYSGVQNYCEDEVLFNVGDTKTLVDNRHGGREYSLELKFTCCSAGCPSPDPPSPACTECYCVERKSGEEIEGTRTTGELQCDAT